MSDEHKGWGQTVLGWFIEKDPAAAGEVTYAPPADTDSNASNSTLQAPGFPAPAAVDPSAPLSQATPAIPVTAATSTASAAPEGKVDYDAVFDAAGIGAEERGQVERAKALLQSLPADADAAVKKQIVAASLKAFGIPIERIIEASAQEIQALEGHIQTGAAQAVSFKTEAERKIAAFEQEIQRIREAAESRTAEQQGVVSACNAKKLEVQQILEFFGQETVAAVVRDSPKLERPPQTSD